MKRMTITATLWMLLALSAGLYAQLPGPGNADWAEWWVKYQPLSINETSQDNWMYGDKKYTGLAFDKVHEVLYVVSPSGNQTRVYVINPETGNLVSHISGIPLPTGGELPMGNGIVQHGLENGTIALYKIDVDAEGRVFACNVVSPSTDSTMPFRIYRWDTPQSNPTLVCEYLASPSTELLGTSFAVAGGMDTTQGIPGDSVRIFVSTSAISSNSANDEILVFTLDPLSGPSSTYRHSLTIRNQNPVSERLFGAGIAPTGVSDTDYFWVTSTAGILRAIEQWQPQGLTPQTINAVVLQTVPKAVTGPCGPIAAGVHNPFYPPSYQDPFIVCGDAIPTSPDTTIPNANLRVRNAVYRYDWNRTSQYWSNIPPGATPVLYNRVPSLIDGLENWIADVDYSWWTNTDPRLPQPTYHQQIYYLLSNNGIVSWMERLDRLWPVELSSFTAALDNGAVQLAWSTATETNNYGFNIERSFGEAWESIGFVEGHGSTTAQQEYTFSDTLTPTHEQSGVIQYRLKQSDFDGTFEYSPVVEVSIGSAATEVSLYQNYPNPFSGSTSISFTVPSAQPLTLTVYNTLGQPLQVMRQQASQGRNEVQLTGLKPGIYMVVLQTREGAATRRMVVSGR